MKNIHLHLLFTLLILANACKKEDPDPEPPTPTEPPIYVPIFEPGDTSMGAANANKLTAVWSGDTYCKKSFSDSTKLILNFYTYTSDGSRRESIGLAPFSKTNIGEYKLTPFTTNDLPANKVIGSYARWSSDGDVLEDSYQLDSTDLKNRFVVTKIDLVNKRVEGLFHASYNIREPRINPANPKKVTFSEGRFWATIRD